jgi:hypothetical protein
LTLWVILPLLAASLFAMILRKKGFCQPHKLGVI